MEMKVVFSAASSSKRWLKGTDIIDKSEGQTSVTFFFLAVYHRLSFCNTYPVKPGGVMALYFKLPSLNRS